MYFGIFILRWFLNCKGNTQDCFMLNRFLKPAANETHEKYKQLLFYLRKASIQFYALPSWECYKVSEIKDLILDMLSLKCCEAVWLSRGYDVPGRRFELEISMWVLIAWVWQWVKLKL